MRLYAALPFLLACGAASPQPAAAPKCPTCEAATPAPAPRRSLEVDARCLDAGDSILVIVAIPAKYTGRRAKPEYDGRTLWHFSCEKATRECEGERVVLSGVDRGEPLDVLQVSQMNGASIVAAMGSTYTVQWGPFRQLTIDTGAGRASYVESAPDLEGRGATRCKTSASGDD